MRRMGYLRPGAFFRVRELTGFYLEVVRTTFVGLAVGVFKHTLFAGPALQF